MNKDLIIKRASQAFGRAYERKIKIEERKNFKTALEIYERGFKEATDIYLLSGNLNQVEVIPAPTLFNLALFTELFNKIYVGTGLSFAQWYERNYQKIIKKNKGFDDIWEQAFTTQAARSAGERVTSIQGTAKKAFLANIRKQMSNPEFANLGIEEKAKILKGRGYWKKETSFLAKRIVRTESNSAANYALEVSAKSLFPDVPLLKKWVTAGDERVRHTHISANGQTIPEDEFFNVGGVQLKRPGDMYTSKGDSKAVASEVINCRCMAQFFPDPDAVEQGILGLQDSLIFDISIAALSTQEQDELFN